MEQNKRHRPSIDGINKSIGKSSKLATTHFPSDSKLHNQPTTEGPLSTDNRSSTQILSNDYGTLKNTNRKKIFAFVAAVFSLILVTIIAALVWFNSQLGPVTTDTAKRIRVTISKGSSPDEIAESLQTKGVIKNKFVFTVYAKLSGSENKLKYGSYDLRPSLSTPKIIEHIVSGKEDAINVTFLPGDTLANGRKMLLDVGFPAEEIDSALSAIYDRPLFASKPKNADLEGYLYGETIRFSLADTVPMILNRFFDEYEAFIKENNLVEGFRKQDLSLFQGITLASIVQRETSNEESQRQVARVFMNRMKIGMNLGSDVTYQYAAKKMGVPPNPTLDSPYNTRIYVGLPPGPIATPGKSALLAVASPAENDFLFFLSGDDNKMYYAKTDSEHTKNIANHCKVKCTIL